MTKLEFMSRLTAALNEKNIPDAADIVEEYENHFAYKLADGYSEEEIAAKLGDPLALAAQFALDDAPKPALGKKPLVVAGLCFADLFSGLFFIMLLGWAAVLVAAALSFGASGVCLIGGLNPYDLMPPMPYWCAAILSLSLLALTVLAIVGCIYYVAFLKQLFRSYLRFHHNALAAASGEAVLPSLAISPQLSGKTKRRLRKTALISLVLFFTCFALAFASLCLSTSSFQFWHTLGWFTAA